MGYHKYVLECKDMMKRTDILNDIMEIQRLGQTIDRFYISYDRNKNITCNERKRFKDFWPLIDSIKETCECQGEFLPITKLVLYTETCVHCFVSNPLIENPLVDLKDRASMDSYVYVNVPLLSDKLELLDAQDLYLC